MSPYSSKLMSITSTRHLIAGVTTSNITRVCPMNPSTVLITQSVQRVFVGLSTYHELASRQSARRRCRCGGRFVAGGALLQQWSQSPLHMSGVYVSPKYLAKNFLHNVNITYAHAPVTLRSVLWSERALLEYMLSAHALKSTDAVSSCHENEVLRTPTSSSACVLCGQI